MLKKNFLGTVILAIILTVCIQIPVQAQIPNLKDLSFLQDLFISPNSLERNSDNSSIQNYSACILLDGRCLFQVTSATKADLSDRVTGIQESLNDIQKEFLKSNTDQLQVIRRKNGRLLDLQVIVGYKDKRLMTVTSNDANLYGEDIETRSTKLIEAIEKGLRKSKQERDPKSAIDRLISAFLSLLAMVLGSFLLSRWERISKSLKEQFAPSNEHDSLPISTQLNQRQQWNLKEIQYRLLQLGQISIWIGGIAYILGLFPDTRFVQFLAIASLRVPIRVILVILITYVFIRFSYALIARFNSAFIVSTYLLNRRANRRLQLRVTTITRISKSIVTIIWSTIGFVAALQVTGVDIGPLLAGAGIVGVAISFASQNLIKDALNGFFIILEDQYAVGDVINIGDVGGLVENMNLRITQLRDSEGRLITVPNSEVKIVANLSSQWSRADLMIPVAYQADLDKALDLISHVAKEMSLDPSWKQQILEFPEVLGVDNFVDRGLIVRVWIKTEPLKQWDVSREFRRRIKIAFDRDGISLPLPQQEVWLNRSSAKKNNNQFDP